MNPLPPLALLTTHINHQHFVIPQVEAGLCNADCPGSALNYVLLVRDIVGVEKPFQIGEVIVHAARVTGEQRERVTDGQVLTFPAGQLHCPLNKLSGR